VQMLVNTLIYDGKIEAFKKPSRQPILSGGRLDDVLYKLTRISLPKNGLTSTPCGICPVFDACSDEGDITPITCIYLPKWLEY